MRYVLTLMLIRRRLMRLEDTTTENGVETMTLYCARDEQTYRVPTVVPAVKPVHESAYAQRLRLEREGKPAPYDNEAT